MIVAHGCQHFVQSNSIRVEHRATAITRKTITIDIHNIDITGPQRDAFLQDFRAFIDQGENAALKNLLIGDWTSFDTGLLGCFDDQFLDNRIGNRIAVAGLVPKPARTSLLPETAQFANLIGYFGIAQMPGPSGRLTLADVPAHIEPCQITDTERAHGKAKILNDFVHLLWRSAFFEQKPSLAEIAVQHAVADEAVAHASDDADLFDGLRQLHGAGQHFFGCFVGAYDFEQLHDVGRAEKTQAQHILRA